MSAPESPKNSKKATTKSGVFLASTVEPESRREPSPQPNSLPESKTEIGATTGIMPIVTESLDPSAVGDTDQVKGSN